MPVFALALAAALTAAMPAGWILAGNQPQAYTIGLDPAEHAAGRQAARLASKGAGGDGFGTLMQQCRADAFRGQRVRLSAQLKTVGVTGTAQLWMRVDGADQPSLAFDNSDDRPITGTVGWKRYEVVLPVAVRAASLHYGVLLAGGGKVWIDDVKVEAIGPLDGKEQPRRTLPEKPRNLGFED